MQSEGQPPASSNAVWIDTNTKQDAQLLADEVTLLVAVLYNTPTVGCFHVQKHVQSRCPKIIEEGRCMGQKLDRVYKGLAKDTQFSKESLDTVLTAHDVFSSMSASVKNWVEAHAADESRIRAAQRSADQRSADHAAAAVPDEVVVVVPEGSSLPAETGEASRAPESQSDEQVGTEEVVAGAEAQATRELSSGEYHDAVARQEALEETILAEAQ